jgi:spermidine synthase
VTLLAAAGALSMVAQVVILRELVAALYGVELLYVISLGFWLVGTASGAIFGRRAPGTAATGMAGCLALGGLVPAAVMAIRTVGPTAGAVTGAYLPFPAQLAWIAAATIPPAAICGALFPVLARLAGTQGRSVGRSYAIESAGAGIGGAGVTLALGVGASTFQVALAAPAVGLAAVVLAAPRWPRRRRLALASLVVAAAAVSATRAGPWDLALLRRMYPALVDATDTPYARVVIVRRDSQMAVFENGALAFDTEGTSAEAFADLAAVQHPRPRRALVIGGGAEGVPDALAGHGIPFIRDLETDRRAYQLVRRYTAHAAGPAEPKPGVSVRFEEPRRYLEGAEPYDLILVATGEPASGAASRFYTREFFAQCARRLTPGGVIAVRLTAAENVWPLPLARRTASIFAALQQEFRSIELVAGATLYLFASNVPLSSDPDVLAGRLADRGVRPRLITPPYLRYVYTNDRRDEVARLLRATAVDGPNRDAAPVCYQYAAMTWLSKFYPGLAVAPGGEARVPTPARWGGLAILAVGLIAWVRRRNTRRAAAFLLGVGFIGMVLETALLLRFQIANGIVYQQIGWLLACAMAGMAAGGYAAGGQESAAAQATALRGGPAVGLPALAAAIASFAAIVWLPQAAGLAGTSVLIALAGAAVGVSFALAARLWPDDAGGAAAALYAADVAGGALGAVAATLVLVPAVGLDGSVLGMVVFAAALPLVIPRSGCAGR